MSFGNRNQLLNCGEGRGGEVIEGVGFWQERSFGAKLRACSAHANKLESEWSVDTSLI
jgi:hypothetical protein